MDCRFIAGLLLLGIAVPTFARERAPVVLVWGEYLAAANAGEARGTRSYMENITKALDAVGLAYDETKDSEVEKGALKGHKFAIFPYNSHLTDAEREQIRRFVAGGGKIWASFTRDPVLNELLGVKLGSTPAPKYAGYYTFMTFNEQAPAGMPDTVANRSWYSHQITPLPGTQVIANWTDSESKDTAMPAITMNDNGCYHGHVMLGGDIPEKGQMFLALVGHFFPELWKVAVEKTIAGIGDIHGFASWNAIGEAIKQAKAQGRDVAVAEGRFAAAQRAGAAARELLKRGKYSEALAQANAAKQALRSATYALALSRDGELRAVWIGGGVDDWEAVMQDLAGAGFNAVFPHLCDAGGANYESDVLPRSKNYERDQLAACIQAARKHNVEVHPWRVNWRVGRGTEERKAELRKADRMSGSRDGAGGDWLCPSDQRNFELEVAAMVEMAEKYPVQGIHFDYIRYANSNFCYCEKCHGNFERDAKVKVGNWPEDVLVGGLHHEVFQDWRREQITRVVRETYKRAHALRPDIVVSAAVFCNWPSSRVGIGQDAAAWAEEGIVDLLMPMTYTDSNERLAKLTEQHLALTRGRAILAEGIGAFSSHSQFAGPDQLVQQIETARGRGADGFCIFSYGAAFKGGGFLPALAEGCTGPRTFTPMLRPPATFKLNNDDEGGWTFGPGGKQAIEATVQGGGPWPAPVASLDATLLLQGLDGRDIRPIGEKQTLTRGRRGTWAVELSLEPGAYRLAIVGQVKLDDDSTRPYICRSRPVRILRADQQAVREGKLPPPRRATGKPRVGVLVDGYGGRGMLEALRKVHRIEAEPVSGISVDAARRCQVLVVTQARAGISVDKTLARALRNWISAGGAVLATHDAVGYRGHAPIAPEVCEGGVCHEKATTVVRADSPLVPEQSRGATFDHAFSDHIVLRPGDRGQMVVTDGSGKPVIVVGQLGKGRFVASGIAFGLNADTREEEPAEDEARLLRELLLWLARKP